MRKIKEDNVVPTPQEWEDMNSFTKRDLDWEMDYVPQNEDTSSGMFDH